MSLWSESDTSDAAAALEYFVEAWIRPREARDVSPLYEEFALGVAKDADVLAFLHTLLEAKRQPSLLFGAVA